MMQRGVHLADLYRYINVSFAKDDAWAAEVIQHKAQYTAL